MTQKYSKNTLLYSRSKTLNRYEGLSTAQLVARLQSKDAEYEKLKQSIQNRHGTKKAVSKAMKPGNKRKVLKEGYVVNPFTKRQIKINGRTHKKLKKRMEKTAAELKELSRSIQYHSK
jgi:prefoldin subunit 5